MTAPRRSGSYIVVVSGTHSELSGRVVSTSQRTLLENTQRPQENVIHARDGTRNRAIPISERPQTYALERAAAFIGL